jgi:2-oxoglutarate ferredoxin oxidoreductase subunit alpha
MQKKPRPQNVDFLQGNEALVEGAIAAGCRFFAGYPITPQTEILEKMIKRLPEVGGICVQAEDELASIAMVIGASWSGLKAMTATSGPGFSLMQEGIGYACMSETPCVVVDIQRVGPATGNTKTQQGDMMQCRWGSNGDRSIIALAPNSVQEMFDLTVEAFNLAESYRVPTFIMADEEVAHQRDRVILRNPENIKIVNRKKPIVRPNEFKFPYSAKSETEILPMPSFGDGYGILVTGMTKDDRGFPSSERDVCTKLLKRLTNKIEKNAGKLCKTEEENIEDADILVVSYGTPARAARCAVRKARKEGIRAGYMRLITIWPFDDIRIREIIGRRKALIFVEMNMGQIVREIRRAVCGLTDVFFLSKPGGESPSPSEILDELRRLE